MKSEKVPRFSRLLYPQEGGARWPRLPEVVMQGAAAAVLADAVAAGAFGAGQEPAGHS